MRWLLDQQVSYHPIINAFINCGYFQYEEYLYHGLRGLVLIPIEASTAVLIHPLRMETENGCHKIPDN